jgi:hypothetical protein
MMAARDVVCGTYSITEFAARLGCDHHVIHESIRQQVARGDEPVIVGVPVLKIGRRWLVGQAAVERILGRIVGEPLEFTATATGEESQAA